MKLITLLNNISTKQIFKSLKQLNIFMTIDLSDGVDYVRFSMLSEKGAPLADFEPCDGSVRLNLDEIWDEVKDSEFTNPEGVLIAKLIDVLGHELNHKWFVWGMGDEFTESFNEQDERVMRVISDWINFNKMSTMIEYDHV